MQSHTNLKIVMSRPVYQQHENVAVVVKNSVHLTTSIVGLKQVDNDSDICFILQEDAIVPALS